MGKMSELDIILKDLLDGTEGDEIIIAMAGDYEDMQDAMSYKVMMAEKGERLARASEEQVKNEIAEKEEAQRVEKEKAERAEKEKAVSERDNQADVLDLFTVGILGCDMVIKIDSGLRYMVDKETFMTNDEYDTIKAIVGHITGRIGGHE
jgi:hypothetical protein